MFDIGAAELLVIVIVAVLVIGPKDMPLAMRTAGRWIGKIRRVSAHFRSGVDAMIREAELEEMEKKWKAHNEAIMAKTGSGTDTTADQMTGPQAASAEAAVEPSQTDNFPRGDDPAPQEPQLPLGKPDPQGTAD
ncbi:twin-arginine translocase subunit TatB [Altererythrobacter sp. BO-6]|uniref:Sec-independent protein translocase protein TatB n=1 Tax=Altererythrobacter sp. BO-6 TaxID=2604537 RepID=UPI0013E0F47B|nr:Sec-independent protein translocase protein TatB [Altererythrobacter sp. BO-6]QIG54860.1 twin-arginine translocase subunit TatB [Altererythrobacter sp. BO-6]